MRDEGAEDPDAAVVVGTVGFRHAADLAGPSVRMDDAEVEHEGLVAGRGEAEGGGDGRLVLLVDDPAEELLEVGCLLPSENGEGLPRPAVAGAGGNSDLERARALYNSVKKEVSVRRKD